MPFSGKDHFFARVNTENTFPPLNRIKTLASFSIPSYSVAPPLLVLGSTISLFCGVGERWGRNLNSFLSLILENKSSFQIISLLVVMSTVPDHLKELISGVQFQIT